MLTNKLEQRKNKRTQNLNYLNNNLSDFLKNAR